MRVVGKERLDPVTHHAPSIPNQVVLVSDGPCVPAGSDLADQSIAGIVRIGFDGPVNFGDGLATSRRRQRVCKRTDGYTSNFVPNTSQAVPLVIHAPGYDAVGRRHFKEVAGRIVRVTCL